MPARSFLSQAVVVLWLGAAIFLGAFVAPAAFEVLPTRGLAGTLVGRVLAPIFWGGMLAALLALLLDLGVGRGRRGAFRTISCVVMLVACAVAQFVIAPVLARIRGPVVGSFDTLPADSPMREAFAQHHLISVGLLFIAVCSAVMVVALTWSPPRTQTP